MPFVAALSLHPLAAHATGEVVGRVLETLAEPPDLALLLVSGTHGRQFAQIAHAVRTTLGPRNLIGATVMGLVAGERTIVDQPAIALWAGTSPRAAAMPLRTRLVAGEVEVDLGGADPGGADLGGAGGGVEGGGDDLGGDRSTLVVLAGPSFPLDAAVDALRRRRPGITVVGGVVAAGVRPADNRLVCDDDVLTDGAVGLLLEGTTAEVIVSRGFRPIGVPLVVTSADGPIILELGGRPILDRLDEVLLELDDATAAGVSGSLQLGQVVDEHQVSFGPGDFAERHVTAVDRRARSLSVDPSVAVGATVQFLGRYAAGADQDLRGQLAPWSAAGAVAFVSAERTELFADPDHDAQLVSTVVDGQATIGAVCSAVATSWARPSIDDGPTAVVLLVENRDGPG